MIHKLGFPLEIIARFKQREAKLTFRIPIHLSGLVGMVLCEHHILHFIR